MSVVALEKKPTKKDLNQAESLSIDLAGKLQILHTILVAHHSGCDELDEDSIWGMQSIVETCLADAHAIKNALID